MSGYRKRQDPAEKAKKASMLVFWEQRLVFLATPKTGSTAVEAALESQAEVAVTRPPALKHTTIGRYRRFVGPWLEKTSGKRFEVVALMREPVDWLSSWYRYRGRDALAGTERSTQGMSFDGFVEGYLSTPCPGFANVGAQSRFLGAERKDGVDRVFRYEEFDGFLAFLEARLDRQITLGRQNVSPSKTTELSPALETRLRQACAADFALYDSLAAS